MKASLKAGLSATRHWTIASVEGRAVGFEIAVADAIEPVAKGASRPLCCRCGKDQGAA